ncbi:unnamed protein product [Urochloa humidicola]
MSRTSGASVGEFQPTPTAIFKSFAPMAPLPSWPHPNATSPFSGLYSAGDSKSCGKDYRRTPASTSPPLAASGPFLTKASCKTGPPSLPHAHARASPQLGPAGGAGSRGGGARTSEPPPLPLHGPLRPLAAAPPQRRAESRPYRPPCLHGPLRPVGHHSVPPLAAAPPPAAVAPPRAAALLATVPPPAQPHWA